MTNQQERSSLSTSAKLYAVAMLGFACNDIIYWILAGTNGLYFADYAFRLTILLFLWAGRHSLPPLPKKRGSDGLVGLLFFVLVVFSMLCEPVSVKLGSGWELFRWHPIGNMYLWFFDLTVGLMLVAVVEELVSRRLAFAVLPGPMWVRWIVSSLLFGLMHWSMGYGHMVETVLIGLAFGAAYWWTGSLKLVIMAHYAVNFLIFGLGAGEL